MYDIDIHNIFVCCSDALHVTSYLFQSYIEIPWCSTCPRPPRHLEPGQYKIDRTLALSMFMGYGFEQRKCALCNGKYLYTNFTRHMICFLLIVLTETRHYVLDYCTLFVMLLISKCAEDDFLSIISFQPIDTEPAP